MKEEHPGIQVRTFSKEIMDAMKKANQELRAELSAKSPELKEILDNQITEKFQSREATKRYDNLKLDETFNKFFKNS